MLHFMKRVRVSKDRAFHALGGTFHGTHALYFGAVFVEGHGVYAMAGGMLLLLTVANWFFHFE